MAEATFQTEVPKNGSDQTEFTKAFKIFAQNTTCHGVRYIVESNFLPKRMLWIAAVLACAGAVGYEIYDRVTFFMTSPVNINFEIIYPPSIVFPAVTICNQNAFRVTEASKRGYYRLLEDMYSDETLNITKYNDSLHSNLTMDFFYETLGHRKEDLIVSCQWNHGKCGPENFSDVLTDHGLCYTFKGGVVSSSGVYSGLRLTLNAEQYEYMVGPHTPAGVKMLLHDPEEFPLVHTLGQSIPTGSHAFADVKLRIITNLPGYGSCGYGEMEYGGFYNTEACFTDCLTQLAETTCGCRDMYMPHLDGHPPICSFEKYYECLIPLVDNFNNSLKGKCDCPVPCRLELFDPMMSYAMVSNFHARKILNSNLSNSLEYKLTEAREVTSRMESEKLENFKSLVENLFKRFTVVNKLLDTNMSDILTKQMTFANETMKGVKKLYQDKERLIRYQIYIVDRNFVHTAEVLEEKTVINAIIGYQEFFKLVESRIRRLANMSFDNADRNSLFHSIKETLQIRQDVFQSAREDIKKVLESFENGTVITDNFPSSKPFEDFLVEHNEYIVPRRLLQQAVRDYSEYIGLLVEYLEIDSDDIDALIEAANAAYESNYVDEVELNWIHSSYIIDSWHNRLIFYKSILFDQALQKPLEVLQERHDKFVVLWNSFSNSVENLQQNLEALQRSFTEIHKFGFIDFSQLLNKTYSYFTNSDVRKAGLVESILTRNASIAVDDLKDFFQEINNRGQSIYDDWTLLMDDNKALWKMVINDEDMIGYYIFSNRTEYLKSFKEISEEIDLNLTKYRDIYDIREVFGDSPDAEMVEAFEELEIYLKLYNQSLKIDGMFVKENFLRLDVFYRELSYEKITQQAAYDFFALICDIGGAMGLFIGASMITVVEVFDLLLSQAPFNCQRDRRNIEANMKGMHISSLSPVLKT